MEEMALIYTTWPDAETAQAAGEKAVEARLAACANILAPMRSIYRWNGQIQREPETPMLLKTRMSLSGTLRDMLGAMHPYEVPCIVVCPLLKTGSNTEFFAWIEEQTLDASQLKSA